MALTTLSARIDDDFCSSVGLTASAAINLYGKTVIRERRIPFEIKQEFYVQTNAPI